MKILKIILLVLFSEIICAQSNNNGTTINGYVYDASTGESLFGANVFFKELKVGANCNSSGYFVISNLPKGEYDITCSYVGYITKVVRVRIHEGDNRTLKIRLEPEAIKQKEVIVTAGPQKEIERLFEQPVSKIELTPTQISKIPQVVETDLLRSLTTLPGIVTVSDYSSALYIRGGTPDQNLYQLDGTDIYNPEHAFGLFSTFNTDAIKKIDLSKGGFGAEYGGRLSSVLSITNLDGNRNNIEGSFGLSLLSAKTTFQSPIGNFGSISGSFRRTYFDQTVAKWIDEVPSYYFFDGNLKAFFDIDDNNKLTVSYYGGKDYLNYILNKDLKDSPSFKYDWGNSTGSINWKRLFGKKIWGNFWITASRFASHVNLSELEETEDNLLTDLTFKGNMEYYQSEFFNLKFGFEQKNLHLQYVEKFGKDEGAIDIDKYNSLYSAFISLNWKPGILWDLETGVRYNYFISGKDFHHFDPRFSIKYRLSESSNLKFAAGIYHQYLERVERGFFTGVWSSADEYVNPSTAYHLILGYQKEISKDFSLELEGFYKKYKDIYSFNYLANMIIEPNSYTENGQPQYSTTKGVFNRSDGYSTGLELLLKKDAGAITGWIGYTLSKSEITTDGINHGKSFTPRYSRTSVLNALVNIDINDFFDEINHNEGATHSSKWSIGLNFIYSTGQPITVPGSVYTINSTPGGGGGSLYIYPTDINEYRLPAYARLDLSITYEKKYDGWSLSPYLQIFNIGNRKNIFFIQYDHKFSNNAIIQEIDTFQMIPILPSIGVNIKF